MPTKNPWFILASCLTLAAISSLAQHLRSDHVLSFRSIAAAISYGGVSGLIIGLIWFNWLGDDNCYFLVGVSGLAGITGSSVVDFMVKLINGNIGVEFKVTKDTKESDDDSSKHLGKP